METNLPVVLDPQTLQAIHSLPPKWQGYAAIIVLYLMVVGRIATALSANSGILTTIKSVFMGSSHVPPPLPDPPVVVAGNVAPQGSLPGSLLPPTPPGALK